MGLEAAELARWTRFAAKGGIGKCVALCDCVAESPDDLMFLKDDEIIVLYQLPEREGFYLGHCEGVVGKFNGADVRFLTKLKKPVMTKRSSVSASSVSGKSPTPTSGTKSPSPPDPPSRRSSSHAETVERRSSSSKARVLSPLSAATPAHSSSDDEGLRGVPHMSRSSISTAPDSVLNTPAIGAFSPSVGGMDIGKGRDYVSLSPREPAFPIAESDGSGPSTTPPPPVVSVSHLVSKSASSSPQSPPPQPRYTSLAPSPLNIFPEGSTSPLRITKRSPLSPPSFPPQMIKPSSPDHPPASLPSADVPDSSYSTLEDLKRFSSASDARVGIGLSLLQDMANEIDSDSDEEERGRKWSKNDNRHSKEGEDAKVDEYAVALSRVGQRDSVDASQESTVEGLGYARSDDGEDDELRDSTLDHMPSELQEFPKPPTSLLSPATSPVSATFDRERRPSLAPSAASTGSWEGASDIYDDYRYSRYSMMSKMSRFSGMAGTGSNPSSTQTPPPIPESRPSMDSFTAPGRTRTDSSTFSLRSRSDSGKSRPHRMDSLQSVVEDRQLQSNEVATNPKRTADKTLSVDSDASVYTHNSRFSTLSQQDDAGGLSGLHGLSTNDLPTSLSSSTSTTVGLRPAPLNLVKQEPSPLLHTRWGSPVSSVGSPKSSLFTSVPPLVSESSMMENAMKSPTFGGFASAMRQRIEEDRVKSPSAELGKGGESEGMTKEKAVIDEDQEMSTSRVSQVSGLGSRIVVEDEDELPSRILDDTFTSSVIHESPENSVAEHADGGKEGHTTNNAGDAVFSPPEAPPSPIVPTHPPSTPPPDSEVPTSGPASTISPSTSHLRPSLAELREGGSVTVPGTNQRRSLFLPHPNAPKSPGLNVTQGPMYISAQPQIRNAAEEQSPSPPSDSQQPRILPQQQPSQSQPSQQQPPPQRNLFGVIRMALAMPPPSVRPQTAPGRMTLPANFYRGPTIYGRTEQDLTNALGPVPIVWSVEPPLPPAQHPTPATSMKASPPGVGGIIGQRGMQAMPRQQPPHYHPPGSGISPQQQRPPPARSMSMGPVPREGFVTDGRAEDAKSLAGGRSVDSDTVGGTAGRGGENINVQGAGNSTVTPEVQKASGGVIPRANFFPKAPGLRPRSRSFSGFNSTSTEVLLPVQRSAEDSRLSASDLKHSLSTSPSSLSPSGGPNTLTAKSGRGSSPLRPSPLSLSATPGLKPNATSPILKAPSSPLAQSVIIPPPPSELRSQQSTNNNGSTPPQPLERLNTQSPPTSPSFGSMQSRPLRLVNSRSTLGDGLPSQAPTSRPSQMTKGAPPSSGSSSFDPASSPPLTIVGGGPGRAASLHAMPGQEIRPFVSKADDSDAVSIRSARSQLTSPPPSQNVGRHPSLRSKLSLPNLRRKPKQDDEASVALSPTTSNNPHTFDNDLLQVQDMEFELIRPNLAHFQQAARTSEDSAVLGRENSLDIRQDLDNSHSPSFLRAESPTVSVSSGGGISGQRSPTVPDSPSWTSQNVGASNNVSRPTNDAESTSMDAHRQREQKWMSLMSSSPASQARKSKKVKKLLIEGVPSSVRYLVWSYLTDGKARSVPGVYAQLCGRGSSKAKAMGVAGLGAAGDRTERIERDIARCFQDQPHLQGQQGPVGVLLQAYLNMVPDVQYGMGLTLIVGQLLLLAPEEDAFWIFVSVMDTHIRSYFSPSTTQMEVDAALFSRALESNDGPLARKLLVDMGISPVSMCQPWFSTLFVGTLPPEYLNRVWDLFLYEGVPFLLRVGLAVVICCRRTLLEATSEESVLRFLLHPPQAWLPASPDAFLSLAFSVKVKDDDVKKQRVKMEAQVKRQTQAPRIMSASGPISLPRT